MRPSKLTVFFTNLALILMCGVTLYPVLWVVKMALSPSQGFAMSPNPTCDRSARLQLCNWSARLQLCDWSARPLTAHSSQLTAHSSLLIVRRCLTPRPSQLLC